MRRSALVVLLMWVTGLPAVLVQGTAAADDTHSLVLDGAGDGLETGETFTGYGSAAVTVECWMRTSVDHGATYLVANNDGTRASFTLFKDGQQNLYAFAVENASAVGAMATIGEGQVEDGQWHHLAGVYDGSAVKLYLDGALVDSEPLSGAINAAHPWKLTMGFAPTQIEQAPAGFFNGSIDEVRIWDLARSAAEVAGHASCELSGSEPGLTFYAELDGAYGPTAGAYTLDVLGTPAFTPDVPFSKCAEVVAHWKMDEDSGSQVGDETGSHDGVANDAPVAAGYSGNARSFNGNQDIPDPISHVLVPDHSDWDLGAQLSVEAWVYPTNLSQFIAHGIVYRWLVSGDQRSFELGCGTQAGSGECCFGASPDGTSGSAEGVCSGVGVWQLNEWQHVVGTFNGGRFRVYRNGLLISTNTDPSVPSVFTSSSPLVIGAGQEGSEIVRAWEGRIDEVRIWDAELTPQEVAALYGEPSVTELPTGQSVDVPLLGGTDQTGGLEATLDATESGELTADYETKTPQEQQDCIVTGSCPPPDFAVPGGGETQHWQIGFGGVFQGLATLVFRYDEGLLGAFPELRLAVYHFVKGAWKRLTVIGRDATANTITVEVPEEDGFSPFALGVVPACQDGEDNDGDTLVDLADGGCTDAEDRSEVPDCSDGLNNDADGLVDWPVDTGCTGASDPLETQDGRVCDDGDDDDGDDLADYRSDPGCKDALSTREDPACDDGIDNDNDGATDWDGTPPDPQCFAAWRNKERAGGGCGLGFEIAVPLLMLLLAWRKGSNATRR